MTTQVSRYQKGKTNLDVMTFALNRQYLTHNYYTHLTASLTWVSRYQNGKTSVYLNEANAYGPAHVSATHCGFTFLVLAHPGSPGKRAVKQVCI